MGSFEQYHPVLCCMQEVRQLDKLTGEESFNLKHHVQNELILMERRLGFSSGAHVDLRSSLLESVLPSAFSPDRDPKRRRRSASATHSPGVSSTSTFSPSPSAALIDVATGVNAAPFTPPELLRSTRSPIADSPIGTTPQDKARDDVILLAAMKARDELTSSEDAEKTTPAADVAPPANLEPSDTEDLGAPPS